MKPVTRASRALQPTFNPASPTYYENLNKAGYISDKQFAAVRSGDVKKIREADKEVFDLAKFILEHPLTKTQSERIDPAFLQEQNQRDQTFKQSYQRDGYIFAPNNGKDNNCLIISLLQHMTGNYKSEHTQKASEYRAKIDKKLKSELTGDRKTRFQEKGMLVADDIHWLLKEMKKDATLPFKDWSVEVWMANNGGQAVPFSIGNGRNKGIIFQGARHFEAVIPPVQGSTAATGSVRTATKTAFRPTSTATSITVDSGTSTALARSAKTRELSELDLSEFEPTLLNFLDD